MPSDLPQEHEDEETILYIRKHWYKILKPLIWVFLGLVIVLIMLRIWGASIVFTIAFFTWLIIGGVYFFVRTYAWFKSAYIITNERVIRKEQTGIFGKKVSEVDLINIHNVTYEISGAVASVFNFGDVILQSFGVKKAVILKDVPKPAHIQSEISQVLRQINTEVDEEEKLGEERVEEKRVEKEKIKKEDQKGPKEYIPRRPKIEE